MIYYPICTLMLAGIKEFLIITTPQDEETSKSSKDGSQWGINIEYKTQKYPDELIFFIISGKFLDESPLLLYLVIIYFTEKSCSKFKSG